MHVHALQLNAIEPNSNDLSRFHSYYRYCHPQNILKKRRLLPGFIPNWNANIKNVISDGGMMQSEMGDIFSPW